jgi:hypothetical protein
LDNVEPARDDTATLRSRDIADEEAWRQAIAEDFSRSWQQASAATDEPPAASAREAPAAPAEEERRDQSGARDEDTNGWGRQERLPVEDWGWPESAAQSYAGRWSANGASSSGGSRQGGTAKDTGWTDFAAQSGWGDAAAGAADEEDGELPDITLFTTEERVRFLHASDFRTTAYISKWPLHCRHDVR